MKPLTLLFLLPLALTGCKLITIEGDFVLFKRGQPASTGSPPAFVWSPYGKTVTLSKTIVVEAGQTLDGKLSSGKLTRLIAAPVLGDGSQREGQKPLILVKPGGTVRNFILDFPAADGVHLQSAPLKTTRALNIQVRDTGEDAMTVTGNGTVLIDDCQFQYASDKALQLNSAAKVTIRDCGFRKFERAVRMCGTCDTQIAYNVTASNCTAVDGNTFMKASTPKARGTINGLKAFQLDRVADASGGAKVTVKP